MRISNKRTCAEYTCIPCFVFVETGKLTQACRKEILLYVFYLNIHEKCSRKCIYLYINIEYYL